MEFSKKLTQIRKQKGLSQEALADQIGVSRQAISKWENEESYPDLPKLIGLSQVLEVSLDELCGKEVSKKEETMIQEAPKKKKISILLIICLLVASFLLGNISSKFGTEEIPDNIKILNAQFEYVPGRLKVDCTTNIINNKFTYEMEVINGIGESTKISLESEDGTYSGQEFLTLKKYKWYTVNLIVSNNKESIIIPVATHLEYSNGSITWTHEY